MCVCVCQLLVLIQMQLCTHNNLTNMRARAHTHAHTHCSTQLIYGKCDCQFHDPATVLYVRPLVVRRTHNLTLTHTQTHTSRRPAITRRNMSCHAKDGGVPWAVLGAHCSTLLSLTVIGTPCYVTHMVLAGYHL